jgi:4-carboxymuconolactone decarboxylase
MSSFDVALASLVSIAGSSARIGSERVRPLDAPDWSPEVRELLGATHDSVAELEGKKPASGHKTLNILRTIAHLPKLLGPFLRFAAALAQNGELKRRDSELLALRAAWNCQSEFEWGHHVVYAKAAGLDDTEIANIARGPTAAEWDGRDRNLLSAADQLHADQQVDDAVWGELAGQFTEAQLVEIPFVVGQYTMLSMVANSTGVELEPGHETLPSMDREPVGEAAAPTSQERR